MGDFAVVAIGYNRKESLRRLLQSLNHAEYCGDQVDLYISVDKSDSDEVENLAFDFEWTYGKKEVLTYPNRNGLRKHVLQCGDIVELYKAIAVFEDDIVVSPGFYAYMKEAVEKYANNKRIAGISLYNHYWNVFANKPFEASLSKYDTYFIQLAQSWGQVWMKSQWKEFRAWYEQNCEEFQAQDDIPNAIAMWPQTSWLKYHIKYCVDNNKYFVYPYKALSTCFTDVGEHNEIHSKLFQIPILEGVKKDYVFPELEAEDSIKYDAFFERILEDDLSIDLYCKKSKYKTSRLLTTKSMPYKVIKTFGMELHPHEMNYIMSVPGKEIILYDLTVKDKLYIYNEEISEFMYRFKLRGQGRTLIKVILYKMKSKLKKICKRIVGYTL